MITILRVDENGRAQEEFADAALLAELLERAANTNHCLRFIDPYGDTTFNRLQLPVLAQELRDAASSSPDLQERTQSLAAFLESAAAAVHTYVIFVGD